MDESVLGGEACSSETGSGVIVSPDGYIVTNHVVKDADEVDDAQR